jgi:hypothetical protein
MRSLLVVAAVAGCAAPPPAAVDASRHADAGATDARSSDDAAPAGDTGTPDGSGSDAVPPADAGAPDAATSDAPTADAASDADAGPPDASVVLCGDAVVGAACGGCGAIACVGGAPVCEKPGAARCHVFEETFAAPTAVVTGWTVHGGGVAFGYADADAHLDLAVATHAGAAVFVGDGAGGFAPLAPALPSGPTEVSSVTWVDYDGDGDLDLFATAAEPGPGLYLYDNDGTGVFADVSAAMGFPPVGAPRGVAWGDYDGDGWLDAYVAGYMAASALLRNLGGGAGFEDVAPALGLSAGGVATFQPLWIDYDGDGDLDLFTTTDRGDLFGVPCKLYRNNGGTTFTDVGAAAGVTHLMDGMGVAAGDIDGDEDLDLYVTNIGWGDYPQMLYVDTGSAFLPQSAAWRVEATSVFGWGADFLDYDADGDLDLALAAHPGTTPYFGESYGAGYLDMSSVIDGFPPEGQFGFAAGDVDADGRPDLAWYTWDDAVGARVYRSVHPDAGHWLRVRLRGDAPNTWGIGALVTVEAGGVRRIRAIAAGNSYLSASEPIAHVGLGAATIVDRIEVDWGWGRSTVVDGPIAADQLVEITH